MQPRNAGLYRTIPKTLCRGFPHTHEAETDMAAVAGASSEGKAESRAHRHGESIQRPGYSKPFLPHVLDGGRRRTLGSQKAFIKESAGAL